MTDLRLVADNTNVETIPIGNLMDLGGMARRLADDIDAGKYGEVGRVLTVIERDDGLTILGWGECVGTFEMIGLLEAAKFRVIADDLVDDD